MPLPLCVACLPKAIMLLAVIGGATTSACTAAALFREFAVTVGGTAARKPESSFRTAVSMSAQNVALK
jgi:hypothetical protein